MLEVLWVLSAGGEGEDEDLDWRDLNLRTSRRSDRPAGVLNHFLLWPSPVWDIWTGLVWTIVTGVSDPSSLSMSATL